MFKKIRDRVRKAVLAARLHDRGICPRHGCPLTKHFGVMDHWGQALFTWECQECKEALEVEAAKVRQDFVAETEAMLKEYQKL